MSDTTYKANLIHRLRVIKADSMDAGFKAAITCLIARIRNHRPRTE